jgi:hypothetical protein
LYIDRALVAEEEEEARVTVTVDVSGDLIDDSESETRLAMAGHQGRGGWQFACLVALEQSPQARLERFPFALPRIQGRRQGGAQPDEGPPPPELTVEGAHKGIHALVDGLRRLHRVDRADVGTGNARKEGENAVPVDRTHRPAGEHAIGELPPGIGLQRGRHHCRALVL